MHSTSSKLEIIQFIKELLKKNNRVIIPNFGAFIVSQGTSDKILFNNFLSFNDGLLTGHLAEQKQLEKNDALILVNELVEEIRSSLETTNEYHLTGLGHFTKDHQGILRFNQDTMSDTATVTPEPEIQAFTTRDLLDIDASSAPVVEDEKPVEVIVPPSFAKEKLLTIDSEKPAEVAAVDTHDADLQFEKARRDEKPKPQAPVAKPVAKPVNPKYVEPPKKVESTENKKNKNWVLIFVTLFVILPLIGLGVYFIGYKDQFKWFKNKAVQEKAVTPTPADHSAPVTTPEPATPANAATPTVVEPSGNGIAYHIIVRTFSSDKDAAAYVDKLKTKGFSSATYFSRGSKYVVSIDNRASIVEADARQEEIVNQYRIESYVLTVK